MSRTRSPRGPGHVRRPPGSGPGRAWSPVQVGSTPSPTDGPRARRPAGLRAAGPGFGPCGDGPGRPAPPAPRPQARSSPVAVEAGGCDSDRELLSAPRAQWGVRARRVGGCGVGVGKGKVQELKGAHTRSHACAHARRRRHARYTCRRVRVSLWHGHSLARTTLTPNPRAQESRTRSPRNRRRMPARTGE